MAATLHIRSFEAHDRAAVLELWQLAGLVVPWNDPDSDIDRKLRVQPELFLVGEAEGVIIASVMAGYDGHRGWINYLAVSPLQRKSGLGRQMMQAAESGLSSLGCPKINLQIRDTNVEVQSFYKALGYAVDPVVSMGKRLMPDQEQSETGE